MPKSHAMENHVMENHVRQGILLYHIFADLNSNEPSETKYVL